jgi:hypothetical protein
MGKAEGGTDTEKSTQHCQESTTGGKQRDEVVARHCGEGERRPHEWRHRPRGVKVAENDSAKSIVY